MRLVNIRDGALELGRRFDRVKSRLLSLAWGPVVAKPPPLRSEEDSDSDVDDEDAWEDQFLVTGCSDSSLRIWDVKTGRVTERMTTDKTKDEATLVWAVGVVRHVLTILCCMAANRISLVMGQLCLETPWAV